MPSQPVAWAEIEAECGDFRSGFVATFRKYEGQPTDEMDAQGRPIKVTIKSFAEHNGIAVATFQRWIRAAQRGHTGRSQRSKNDLTRDVKRAATAEPDAVIDGIRSAPAATRKQIRDAMLKDAADAEDVETLSKATAQASANRQVTRNRKRLDEGAPKKGKPSVVDAESAAFLFVVGKISDATRTLEAFIKEWEALDQATRQDEDLAGAANETLDHHAIVLDLARSVVSGSVSDADIAALMGEDK